MIHNFRFKSVEDTRQTKREVYDYDRWWSFCYCQLEIALYSGTIDVGLFKNHNILRMGYSCPVFLSGLHIFRYFMPIR